MKLKTNVKINFNIGLFETKKDFFEAEINTLEVTEFDSIRVNGYYYYTLSGEKIVIKTFSVSIKKKDADIYFSKFTQNGATFTETMENMFYYLLKEVMAKEFALDVNTIDIIDSKLAK